MKGSRAPLDRSLKLLARITSSYSFHWCHRPSSITQCEGVQHFTPEVEAMRRKTYNAPPGTSSGKSGGHEKFGAPFWNSVHSGIFPQSSLPPTVLSVVSSAAACGGEAGPAIVVPWHCRYNIMREEKVGAVSRGD